MKLHAQRIFLFSIFFLHVWAHAQGNAPASSQTTTTPAPAVTGTSTLVTTSGDFSGVRLSYPVRVVALVDGTNQSVCIPAGFELRGLGLLTSAGLPVKLRATKVSEINQDSIAPCNNAKALNGTELVSLTSVIGQVLIIDEKITKVYTPRSNGLTYGGLVVPFKYYVNGSRDFKGAGSIGPYAGWKSYYPNLDAGIEFVGFAGLGVVKAENTVDGKTQSDNLAAFSFGLGAIGRIHDDFQIGLIIGQDKVGKSSQYKDDGKWWIALSVGYPFSK